MAEETFVRHSDFTGKRVVLFHTYNSNFNPEEINRFGKAIQTRGGKLIDHIFVLRDRMPNQITSEELVVKTQKILDEKREGWVAET